MRLAVIADIHANALALEAVLADMTQHAPDLIVDLGDIVSGPLWPAETMQLLADVKPLTVRGNHDRLLTTLPPADMGSWERFAYAALSAEQMAELSRLPTRLEIADGVLAFHASPDDDQAYLTEEIVAGRLVRARQNVIGDRLGDTRARLVLAGHSHLPQLMRLASGTTIVNPGSVGCPAYADDAPPHVSEAGSPHARYAVIDLHASDDPVVRHFAVTYAWDEAARRAEQNGNRTWVQALRTGFAT